jgi:hypothetical protein
MIIMKSEHFQLLDEEHAEVSKHLCLMWGKKEFRPFINKLLDVTVSGRAREFGVEALLALIELSKEHHQEFRI